MHKENDGLIIFLLSKGKSGFTSNTFLIPQQDLFMAYIRHGFGRCLIEVLRTYLQDLDGELSTYNERELGIHLKLVSTHANVGYSCLHTTHRQSLTFFMLRQNSF